MQVSVPEQPPDQPLKIELAFGFAVSTTDVPLANVALHAEPQLIPAGLLVTVPPPVPASWTVIPTGEGEAVVTLLAWGEPQPARYAARMETAKRRDTTSV